MSIRKDMQRDLENATRYFIRKGMPEAKMLDAEICWDLDNMLYTSSWTFHRVPAGLERNFFKDLGFEVCRKRDALVLLQIGEKHEGLFYKDKTRSYWLKPKL